MGNIGNISAGVVGGLGGGQVLGSLVGGGAFGLVVQVIVGMVLKIIPG